MVVFSIIHYSNILEYRDHQWDLWTIWKKDSFRHMLKISARMYESSGSQFLRTTTSMQSRLNAFYKSRFAITFLTILGVTEMLCSFILVLEGKVGKETSKSSILDFLEKELGNNFASWDGEGNTSALLNRGGLSDSILLRKLLGVCQKSQELSFL